MSEHWQKLESTIRELENELNAIESLDSDTRRMLEETLGEIQAALRNKSTTSSSEEPIGNRLQTVMQEFETTHPNLTGILARVIDSLAQMGI